MGSSIKRLSGDAMRKRKVGYKVKRVEVLRDPLKAARVVAEYMGCMRCKYQDKCNSTPVEEIGEHETMCEKIWFDVFSSGTVDLKRKSMVQMSILFNNIFTCRHCPVVRCKFNTIGHKYGNYCIRSEAVYWWLNEDVTTCQENRQDGLDALCYGVMAAKKNIERTSKNMVDHPNHYQLMDGVEVIDIIDHILSRADLTPPQDFCLGNVIKYVLRADLKNGVEDYKKASVYLHRLINSMDEGAKDGCGNRD